MMRQDVQEVVKNIVGKKNCVVSGHKGPFWLMYLQNTPVVGSCVIDYMHGACQGVMKMLL